MPSPFIARAPVEADAPKILELINAYDIAQLGAPDSDLDYVLGDWREPGFSLADDARIVMTPEGQVIGYELVLDVHDNGAAIVDGYVHPAYHNQGIGTYLLRWAETRARQRLSLLPPDIPKNLRVTVFGHDKQSPPLLAAEGYHVVRHHWRMEITMETPPVVPTLPEGIRIRSFIPGQDDYQTWETVQKVFEEEWGVVARSFEDWKTVKFTDPDFDPSLWWLAVTDEQIIGIALGKYRMETGWLTTVGMRREWRRKGIALALLHHAFAEFYQRGRTMVGLGVDSQNPTGATRVYERAGMHAARVFDTYEKSLTVTDGLIN